MTVAVESSTGRHWQWQGYQVYLVRAGTAPDRPPLLLVHGFGASTDHWRKNIAELEADFEVWAIDLIGFGRSSKPDRGYSADLWRDLVHDVITKQIGRPAVLAGNSIGAYTCLTVAAAYPQDVAGVCLLNGVGTFSQATVVNPPNPFQTAVGDLIKGIVLSPLPSWVIFQYVRRKSAIRKTLEQVYLDPTAVTDQLVEDIYRPATEPGAAAAFAALFKAPRGESVDRLLETTTCPLLLLWGEGDPWMDTHQRSQLYHQHYANLEEHFLKAGHCPHDEVPEQVNGLIRDWVLQTVIK